MDRTLEPRDKSSFSSLLSSSSGAWLQQRKNSDAFSILNKEHLNQTEHKSRPHLNRNIGNDTFNSLHLFLWGKSQCEPATDRAGVCACDKRWLVGSHCLLPHCNSQGLSSSPQFGSKHLYLVSHLTGSQNSRSKKMFPEQRHYISDARLPQRRKAKFIFDTLKKNKLMAGWMWCADSNSFKVRQEETRKECSSERGCAWVAICEAL